MAFTQGHALVIGVGAYAYIPQARVPAAAVDARAVAEVLQDAAACGYPPGQVELLLDEQATQAATLAALERLAKRAGPQDTVFLFYCGHGANGSDGSFTLVSHDARYSDRVLAGTGVTGEVLIDRLRALQAGRVFVALNTCYSGAVSPSLDLREDGSDAPEIEAFSPPEDTTAALLATGSGRIIITAAGAGQKSYIGAAAKQGGRSIFTAALVDGLRGRGVANNRGFISAYSLYEQVYASVSEAAEALGQVQQPELTVLKGVGPFAVALYRGADTLGGLDDSASRESIPDLPGVRQVKPETAARLLRNASITVHGTYIAGNVTVNGGDFVGGDKIVKN